MDSSPPVKICNYNITLQKNKKIWLFVKLTVSLCLIAWIIGKVNIDETLRILYSVKIV